jgi:hypothetical protein
MPSDIPFTHDENVQLERAFKQLLRIWIKLVLKRVEPRIAAWPAMQVDAPVAKFIHRNHKYAKPTNDPVYRKQPV